MSSRRSRSGGTRDPDDVQAVEQIEPEPARGDFLPQIAIGRGDQADVDAARDVFADPAHLAFLDAAQDLGLRAR